MSTLLDGNVLAGALRELFAVEVTAALARCAGCGDTSAIGQTLVYADAPGLVARCPGCDGVVVRLVRGPGRAWLDLSGVSCLEVALGD
jgi:hypothetical protein